jgi:predicted DNA-binding transcriptional regulator AlpA
MPPKQLHTQLHELRRMRNTEGNPRWRLVTSDGEFTTKPASQVGYSSALNPAGVPKRVTLWVDEDNHVVDAGEYLWTMPDIAEELGLARSTVEAYRSREQMPAPTGTVGATPYWRPEDIEPWMRSRPTRAVSR